MILSSFIVPCFNSQNTVKICINSILHQNNINENVEIIIIDDGSTDNSIKIIKSYSDQRILILRHDSNKGIAKALNFGLEYARCRFIARMDANDIAYPSRFAEQYNFFSNHPKAVAVFCPVEKINKDVRYKFGNKNNFYKKINELNQETETLIDEIEKWQT